MGEREHVSAGATRTRMREILNYRCECELGIRNEMGTFMIFRILTKPMKINQKLSKRKSSDEIFDGKIINAITI